MATNTPFQGMPEIEESQASKYITHNSALQHIDAKMNLLIQDKDLVTSPAHANGDVWIVGGNGGSWSFFTIGNLAQSYDGSWYEYDALEGMVAYMKDESAFYYYNGSSWVAQSSIFGDKFKSSLGDMEALGFSDPGYTKVKDDGGGSTGVYVPAFDPSTEEELFFNLRLGNDYVDGNDISFTLRLLVLTSSGGDIRFGIEYSQANSGGTPLSGTNYIYADHTVAVSDTNEIKEQAFSSDIDGTGIQQGAHVLCRIFRDATHSTDTLVDDVGLLGVSYDYV